MSDTVAAGQLRALIERIERIEAEIKELNADKSDIYKEARGFGYDVKAIRQCVAARKLDDADREEQDAIFELYWNALTGGSRVHVHEEQPNSPATAYGKAGGFPVPAAPLSRGGTGGRNPENIAADERFVEATVEQRSSATNSNPQEPTSSPATADKAGTETPPSVPAANSVAEPQTPPATEQAGGALPPASPAAHSATTARTTAEVMRLLRPLCQHVDDLSKCAGQGAKHCHACAKAGEKSGAAA